MSSIVLLSGGLDSAVSLAQALREGKVKLCLTFDYGQRAAAREAAASAGLAGHYGLDHRVIELPFLRSITSTSLVNLNEAVPEPGEGDLDSYDKSTESAKSVWVPNRNGIFINIAAGFAESMGAGQVVTGFNAEEAKTFPDNSAAYLQAAGQALYYSTLSGVRGLSYTMMLNKTGIVKLGRRLGVPLAIVWPCYYGGEKLCGRCESCKRYLRALEAAGE
ncbi:MAG: 7-cyano-7-deazaguanine synthase QueC [Firmicutes bacterium]|nr:7-cyano-7-deazaguanine synthase QueC [Bacillota bacterium]